MYVWYIVFIVFVFVRWYIVFAVIVFVCMVHCICVYGTLYLYAWYIVFVMVCLCVVYYMCDGICDFNYYECVSSCVTWTIFMHGTVQSHLNQPQTLAPLLPAVRIWLHSVRGHVQMCSQSNRRLQQAVYITKTFRLCLTRFYEGKNHWTTNEHSCFAYLFLERSYERDLLRSVVRS